MNEITVLLLFCAAFGITIGAFMGTLQFRLNSNLPIFTVNCFCPKCRHRLPLHHQIPVLGWVLLGGKCGFCKSPIPLRYPLTEVGFAAFYSLTLLFLYPRPGILVLVWITGAVLTLFLIYRVPLSLSSLKAMLILLVYHLIYGGLLGIILS